MRLGISEKLGVPQVIAGHGRLRVQQTVTNFFFFFLLVDSISEKQRGRISVRGTDFCVNSIIAVQGNVCFADVASVI